MNLSYFFCNFFTFINDQTHLYINNSKKRVLIINLEYQEPTTNVTARFSLYLILIVFMCVIYARMWLIVFVGILTGLVWEEYFSHFENKGNLVISWWGLF